MTILQRRKAKAAALVAMLTAPIAGFESTVHAGVANPGDLIVEQVGNGAAALTNGSTAVFLDIYTPNFASNGTVSLTPEVTPQIILPNTSSANGLASNPLTTSGTATSEGQITLSGDGNYVLVPGYDINAGSTGTSIASSNSTTTPREVGLVNVNTGAIDTSTTTTAFNGNNIRSAATADDINIYTAGATSPGVSLITADSTNGNGTQVQNTVTNIRQVELYNGVLYVSDSSGNTVHLGSITGFNGTANSGSLTELPGTSANNATSPTGYEIAGPYTYAFANNGNTLYLVDQASNGANGAGTGALDKFVLNSGNYTFDGSVTVGNNNATGLTLDSAVVNGVPITGIFVTSPSEIYEVSDAGGSLAGDTLNSVQAVGTNEAFRGIVSTPTAVPEPASIGLLGIVSVAMMGRRRRR